MMQRLAMVAAALVIGAAAWAAGSAAGRLLAGLWRASVGLPLR